MFKLRLEYAGRVGYISRRLFQDRYGNVKRGEITVTDAKVLAESFNPEDLAKHGWFNMLVSKGIPMTLEKEVA